MKNRGSTDEPSAPQSGGDKDKQISLADIRKVTRDSYNLANKMGTLLSEKYDFDSLEKIRIAYSLAFEHHYQPVDEVLADPALDALSAVRNVIIHAGGCADEEYCDRMKSVPGIPALKPTQRLELDGEWVVKLITPVFTLGCRLLTNVSKWIKNH
jgi:hypothetical protein